MALLEVVRTPLVPGCGHRGDVPYYLYQGKRDTNLKIGINHELPFWKFMKTNV